MSGDTSDEFQKELVDLFVQEAHEWLQNIHVALDELQQGPPPERHAALIGTLTAGVTNLGGSAATINLLTWNRPVSPRCPSSRRSRTRRSHFPCNISSPSANS